MKYDVALENIIERENSNDHNYNSNEKSQKITRILRKNNIGMHTNSSNLPFDGLEFDAKIKSNFHAIGSKDVE